ncbi:DNA recombination protein RmuC [Mucinivorans hirudinis]|uniref:DNA recombination protein RmuC n=1 Tax=Mucinivorans hirudinis TaxID=1433126 RepID=A0A060RAJ5_9BACT|nr:DNA recombination protein RmuC [Mucinivorans hirudinis]
MEIFFAIVGAVAATFFIFLYLKKCKQNAELAADLTQERLNSAILAERVAMNVQRQRDMDNERTELLALFNSERGQMSEQFSAKFNVLANEILENKSRAMSMQNNDSLSALLKPFGEQIDKFRERIEQESKQRFALQMEVKRLAELNLQMSREANNLTAALKGNSKAQGDWGEMILETLLENSGLTRDVHFQAQHSLKDGNGRTVRPDVILFLPEGKQVVIDSKVSLVNYVTYCENQDAKELSLHLASIRNHINSLSQKSYQKLVASPDFTIMFIPNEPAFLLALQNDNDLWYDAYSKGVIMSSPTNLFAILRIVDDLWKRDSQSKNALEIARQGGELYDKFVGFVDTISELGKSIKKSEELYEKSYSQLNSGAGNLVRRAERLRQMGIKNSKKLPQQLTDNYEDS